MVHLKTIAILIVALLVSFNTVAQDEKISEKKEKVGTLSDYEHPLAKASAESILNERMDLHSLLPSFVDMEKEPTAEEIVRVAGLTEAILHLTFKNPFPIDQDPVFETVYQAYTYSFMECLKNGKFDFDDALSKHDELRLAYESKYPEQIAKQMVDLDYWTIRMIEHVVLMKSLGPKPAYNCLSAAYNLLDFANEPSCVLIITYAHLLLKYSMLKKQNPMAIEDIKMALKQASTFLGFEEGINYVSASK